jgi:hypothetical protein
VSKSGDALCDRPDPIKPQGIDRQAAQRGQDLNAVVFSVAVGVFSQRYIPHPMPAVLDRPALPDGFEHGLGASAQTRDVVTGLVLRLALAGAMAAHGDDRRAARPLLHHPLRSRHRPQAPGDVTAPLDFPFAGAPGDPAAVGEPVSDQAKSLAAAVFDGNQEVGAALGEVKEKGRFACSASACTSTPSSSTASSSWRRAWISPLASVA